MNKTLLTVAIAFSVSILPVSVAAQATNAYATQDTQSQIEQVLLREGFCTGLRANMKAEDLARWLTDKWDAIRGVDESLSFSDLMFYVKRAIASLIVSGACR